MTTILGIKANASKEGIVLAADSQLNFYEGDDHTGKAELPKIHCGKTWAIAFAGHVDKYLHRFFRYLGGGKEKDLEQFLRFIAEQKKPTTLDLQLCEAVPKDIRLRIEEITDSTPDRADKLEPLEQLCYRATREENPGPLAQYLRTLLQPGVERLDPVERAIRDRFFRELLIVNRYYASRGGDMAEAPELLLATSKPEVQLYHVDPFGNVSTVPQSDEIDFFCLGSGSKIVKAYISENQYQEDPNIPQQFREERIRPDNITLPLACWMAYSALRRASKDVNTGGYINWVVIADDQIINCGANIKGKMADFERTAIQGELDALSKPG